MELGARLGWDELGARLGGMSGGQAVLVDSKVQPVSVERKERDKE